MFEHSNGAVPQIIHTPPTEGIKISWGWGDWGGVCNTKTFGEIYEALLEFPEGWGIFLKKPFRGGGMEIFWNYTMQLCEYICMQ